MPLFPFLLYSTAGTAIWTALLAGAGYVLEGQYQKVSDWVNSASNVVVGLLVLWYVLPRPDVWAATGKLMLPSLTIEGRSQIVLCGGHRRSRSRETRHDVSAKVICGAQGAHSLIVSKLSLIGRLKPH